MFVTNKEFLFVPQQQNRYDDRRDSSRNRENRRSNNNNSMDGNGEKLTFTISKGSVGLVIGRGGSNIKDVQTKYHVSVNIGKLIELKCSVNGQSNHRDA